MFRFVLFSTIAYFIWRLIDSAFFSKREPRYRKREPQGHQHNTSHTTPKDRSIIPDEEGDYIDFEEVK